MGDSRVSGRTKAEREAREWLRLTAWVGPEQESRATPSMLLNGPRHVRGLLDVIEKLREQLRP